MLAKISDKRVEIALKLMSAEDFKSGGGNVFECSIVTHGVPLEDAFSGVSIHLNRLRDILMREISKCIEDAVGSPLVPVAVELIKDKGDLAKEVEDEE